jgi:hypothetical protein
MHDTTILSGALKAVCVCMHKGLQELVAHYNSAAALTCSKRHGSANATYNMQATPSCTATVKPREQSARRCARIEQLLRPHIPSVQPLHPLHAKCTFALRAKCASIAFQMDAHRLDPMSMDPSQCTNGADLEPRSNCRAGHC